MGILFALAYDGAKYHGFARQRNVRTIEGELLQKLESLGLRIRRLNYLSRTDKGVHAVSQYVNVDVRNSFSSFQDIISILNELNACLPECITIYKATYLKKAENIRHLIKSKTYLYIAPDFGENVEKIQWAIDYINMKEHDFSSLVKRPSNFLFPVKMRMRIRFILKPPFQYFFVRAKGFLWEQVRRIITLLKAFALGRIGREEFERVLRGWRHPKGISPAPAEGLILWEVVFVKKIFKWFILSNSRVLRKQIEDIARFYAILNSKSWVFP